MIKIDVHGLTHQQAVKLVESRLIKASEKGSFECTIVTGKSDAMNKVIINEVLNFYNFDWIILQYGSIYVTYTKI